MRYKLEKSQESPGWWLLTDTETWVAVKFKEREFNETQEFTIIDASKLGDFTAESLAAIANGMADWLASNHRDIAVADRKISAEERARLSVGEQIRAAREKKGLTLRQLADKCGLAFNHISRIEQGRYNVTIDTLAKVCEALGVDIAIE